MLIWLRHMTWRIMAKYGCPQKLITIVRQFHDGIHTKVQDNGENSVAFPITNGIKQEHVLAPILFRIMFPAMLFDVFSGSDIGNDIWFLTDSSVFNFRRLQANTKVKTDIVEFLFTNDCALNVTMKSQHAKQCWQVLSSLWQLWHKKDRSDTPVSAWKTIHWTQYHHQGTMTEGDRKVHLPRQHPL